MKITLLFIASIVYFFSASAQNSYQITGRTIDKESGKGLANFTVTILNAKDSTLVSYSYTDANGQFRSRLLPAGKMILLVTYPNYTDYVEPFESGPSHDFGNITMQLKAKLLQEVIIKGQESAIKLKGDTTVYNAKAFVIRPNDKVEDLIKQFPGLQVDRNGKITAQGQTINKVLLDGEEFFGDDPTLVTRNIRADMVDKVELFDKKSDQAAFTGIDDGKKTKTLNIKLKEDKKFGYFGKIDAGAGVDGYYQSQVLFNKFKGKEKLSGYGAIGNTGKTGLSFTDNRKYVDGSNDAGGEVVNYNNEGIPSAVNGGLHYDNKWSNDKKSINANYRVGSLIVDGQKTSLIQNNLPTTGTINTKNAQSFNNNVFRQKVDVSHSFALDSSSNLKIAVSGILRSMKIANNFSTENRDQNDALLNSNRRSIDQSGDLRQSNISFFYTKKLVKGRTFSALLSQSNDHNRNDLYLRSEVSFYSLSATPDSSQLIDQYKEEKQNNNVYNLNLTYTHPISKIFSLSASYGINLNNNQSDNRSFNASAQGSYSIFDPTVSNNFKLDQFTNQGSINFNYKNGKTRFNASTRLADVTFKQKNLFNNDLFQRKFLNWSPSATYEHEFTKNKSLQIYYDGTPIQPTLTQLQPIRSNNDPLNIYVGNQELRPSFNNRLMLYYNAYQVLTNQFINMVGNFSYTSNPITSSVNTDQTGRSTIQYVNLPGQKNISYYLSGNITRKIKKPELNLGINGNISGERQYGYINNVLGYSRSSNYQVGASVSQFVQNKYDFNIRFGPTYNMTETIVQTDQKSSANGFNASGGVVIYLPFKLQLSPDFDYTYIGKTQAFDTSLQRTLLNITLSKTFLKKEDIKLSLTGNDLLNQNTGFIRTANSSLISQSSVTTIKRYFLLSLVWDFNKLGRSSEKK